jgi:hypothetical protein
VKAYRILLTLLAALLMISAVTPRAMAEDNQMTVKERRALFLRGAQLWPVYCNTCHNARPGSEFSPAEWQMIMMHMRTQANLPGQDARAVLEYLKASR